MERTLKQSAPAVLLPAIAITDGELLMRYARHGDEAAFAELVEKHGRLVWTVCWQVLRHHQEIEDAFQSTFFILAKRARSIRSCDSLCGWLYRVAYRTALRSRMAAKRKPVAQLVANELESLDNQLQAIEQCEQRAQLLEELHSLPEKYQQPLILCYLEGQSRRAIAEELGCSLETIKGRLARGRQMLRHRLICRGVSLSLAMGAMAVPVKSALAAVTPQLVGLTATGAATWAAGAAKVSSTVSSQVIHLAHQGTVAMTITSIAKPAMLAVALLGAASATMAVNSSDQAPAAQGAKVIDLQAGSEVPSAIANDESAVELIVAKEVPAGRMRPTAPQPPQPTNSSRAQSVEVYVPVPKPVVADLPAAEVHPFTFEITGPLDFKLQQKLVELETRVLELQLEGKVLEIEAFDAESEEEKEEILREARKKLLMAETERFKLQIERQRAQIEVFKKAVEQQAKGVEQQARGVEQQARGVEQQARGVEQQARGVVEQAAQAAIQARTAVAAGTRPTGPTPPTVTYPDYPVVQPADALSLKPGDQIQIEVTNTLPEHPIHDFYKIEPMGTVALGASYGRVKIAGLSLIDAEKVILDELKTVLQNPQVQVTLPRSLFPSTTQPTRQPAPQK